ncbi:Oidioi.mRNA.OKI2018_I69.chr2.g4067.t1.cds [Oikopleura dioica]|uniref:Oidioi.mRNA.OKI2018_I69.chr2.g4067.t1.cds n=1 Tax=Oikopleura dioica TaxID=34765 RepID=A0ABN7T596_OIKDI|nr:Oidioi.mRNA.OKI2018_I69.chr2.g4067.t1.cds [Oikopleura dioica]
MIISFVALACSAAQASRVKEEIFWNVDNFRFANSYSLDVNLEDKVDIYCPQYSSAAVDDRTETFSTDKHYQTIYMVDEESFNSCRLGDFRSFKKIMTCSQPVREKKFTVKFQEVSPSPFGLEFKPDVDYFFISTSNGDQATLDQKEGGVCSSHSMKMRISVHRGDETGIQRITESTVDSYSNDFASSATDKTSVPVQFLEPEMEKQEALPNAMIIGIVVGLLLVVLSVIIFLLARRVFMAGKGSDSFPTMSDYQSSYVEKYDPSLSPQSMLNYSPGYPNSPQGAPQQGGPTGAIVDLYPAGRVAAPSSYAAVHIPQPMSEGAEFSYFDGSQVPRLSSRTNDIVMV